MAPRYHEPPEADIRHNPTSGIGDFRAGAGLTGTLLHLTTRRDLPDVRHSFPPNSADATRGLGWRVKFNPWPVCRCLLLAVGCTTPLVMSAGFKPGFGWPEITTPFYRAVSANDASERAAHWRRAGLRVEGYRDSGSMRPFLSGGRELLAMEACDRLTPLEPGLLVQFDRGDKPAVLHYIAVVSADGQHVYMSGVGNPRSDGWFDRSAVHYVVREIITSPTPTAMPPGLAAAASR